MRTLTTLFAALLLLHAPHVSAQSARATSAQAATQGSAPGKASPRTLVGTWKSAEHRLPLSTPFDESVWGKNAVSVRTVELQVPATGPATLTVTRKVLNAVGQTVAGSTSIEQAQLTIAEPAAEAVPVTTSASASASRTPLAVDVVSAERRYPDPPVSTWPLQGLRVTLTQTPDEGGALDVRFDTPEGRGSFWETLHRAGVRPAGAK